MLTFNSGSLRALVFGAAVTLMAFGGAAVASDERAKIGDPVQRSAAGAARDRPQPMAAPGNPGAQPVTCKDGTLGTAAPTGCADHGGPAKKEALPSREPRAPSAGRRATSPQPSTAREPPPR
jgi:hypothetical protein